MTFTKVTDPVDNITNQPNQPVIGATALKALFDETGKDLKTYINDTLLVELEKITDGDSGADNIGATPLSGGVANTVQGVLEELKSSDNSTNVKLTGNQTIDGIKTFVLSPVVPNAIASNQAINKGQLDAHVIDQIPDDSITNDLLETDVKVGSLLTLKTDSKISVVSAINEIHDESNIPEQSTITISGEAKAITVTDSVAGTPDIIIKSDTFFNAIKNGDFSVGTTNFTGVASSLSATNKILSITGSGANNTPSFHDSVNVSPIKSGQKYFIKNRVRVTNAVCQSIKYYLGGATLSKTILNPVQNQWYEFFEVLTPASDRIYSLLSEHTYVDATTANGKVMEVDGNVGVFTIPITGTPYESMTASEINNKIGLYFEGLKSSTIETIGSKDSLDNITSSLTITALRNKLPNLVEDTLELTNVKWLYYLKTKQQSIGNGVVVNTTNLVGAKTNGSYQLAQTDGTHKVGIVDGSYTTTATGTINFELATPLVIEEKDFLTYGVVIDGSLSSNNVETEFYASDYTILSDTLITYPISLASAIDSLKYSVNAINNRITGWTADNPWITPTLINSWVNYGNPFDVAGYYRNDFKFVELKGLLKSGVIGQPAWVLPVGYRPEKDIIFNIFSNGIYGALQINATGEVVPTTPSNNASVSVQGISFRAV